MATNVWIDKNDTLLKLSKCYKAINNKKNYSKFSHPSSPSALSNYNIATVEEGKVPVSYLQIPSPRSMQPITVHSVKTEC